MSHRNLGRHGGPREGYRLPSVLRNAAHALGTMYPVRRYSGRPPRRGIEDDSTGANDGIQTGRRRAAAEVSGAGQWASMGVRGSSARTHVSLSYSPSLPVSGRPLIRLGAVLYCLSIAVRWGSVSFAGACRPEPDWKPAVGGARVGLIAALIVVICPLCKSPLCHARRN
jgi:hypothetical protein